MCTISDGCYHMGDCSTSAASKWKIECVINLKEVLIKPNWKLIKITPSAGDLRVHWYNQDKTRTLSSKHWSRTLRCQDWEPLWSNRGTKTASSAKRANFHALELSMNKYSNNLVWPDARLQRIITVPPDRVPRYKSLEIVFGMHGVIFGFLFG